MEDLENHHNQASLLSVESPAQAQSAVYTQSSELSEAQGIDDSYGKQEEFEVEAEDNKHIEETPLCFNCGNITQRAGSCYVCTACGSTSGCS